MQEIELLILKNISLFKIKLNTDSNMEQSASKELHHRQEETNCQTIADQKIDFTILTIHHLSATGGTLISKCLAVMPDVILLSEIHPHVAVHSFNPLDPIQQLTKYGLLSNKELEQILLERIDLIVDKCQQNNKKLILRDHAHSDFLQAHTNFQPSLLNVLKNKYPTKSLVTLRHPIDSWLSIILKNWHKHVQSFDKYCDRYLRFLDTYQDFPYYLYEDFVLHPDAILQEMCQYYDLDFDPDYKQKFFAIKLTGDSGRSSSEIAPRPRREYQEQFVEKVRQSTNFQKICHRLGYSGIDSKEAEAIKALKGDN